MSTAALRRRDFVYRPPLQKVKAVPRHSRYARKKADVRNLWTVVLLSVILLSLLFLRLEINTFNEGLSFELQERREFIQTEINAITDARARLSTLESPLRIRREAIQRLGMVEPDKVVYLTLSEVVAGPSPYGEGKVLAGLSGRAGTERN